MTRGLIRYVGLFTLCAVATCCTGSDPDTEKHQAKRDHTIDASDELAEIQTGEVLIGSVSRIYIIGDYLIIADHKATGEQIHLFDRQEYEHIASTGPRGQGPGEITMLGHIGIDETKQEFYVADHGKQKIFSYDVDSVIANPDYEPEVLTEMKLARFPDKYVYVNDTLSYALLITPTSNSTFEQTLAKWNIREGTFEEMAYRHPDIRKKRISFAISTEQSLYVECYSYHDLMTIGRLDGSLVANVYGPDWTEEETNKTHYYGSVVICGDKIVASYSGEDTFSDAYHPTKLYVFNLKGDYLQTLDIGQPIIWLCYDDKYDRLIMNLGGEYQFAYLPM